jgi:copper(I)-binding protein
MKMDGDVMKMRENTARCSGQQNREPQAGGLHVML